MKNLEEDLKALRDSPNVPPPSFQDLEKISAHINTFENNRLTRKRSFVSRLLPDCYSTFTFNNLNVKNFHEETLFFIFYSLPESELQIKGYNELINRGYRFSKTLDAFVFFNDPKIQDNKKRTILVFDPFSWEKIHKEIVFDNEFISGLEEYVTEAQ